MAAMLLEEGQLGSIQEIDIDIDNYEERHIYNSICEYSRRMCEFFSNKIDKLSPSDVITRDRTILKRKIEPRSQPTIEVLQPAQTKLFRSDTEIVINRDTNTRIKKIDSNQFKNFFTTNKPPEFKTIKDVNRQIILELQSLTEKQTRIKEIKKIIRTASNERINQEGKQDDEEDQQQDAEQVIQKQPIKNITYKSVNYPNYKCGIEGYTVNYIMYDERAIVVLPIPDDREKIQIIFNSNGTWVPNGGIGPGYPKCKTCPFYRSTGKSNEKNFPDMWFPFFRVKTSIPQQENSISKLPRGWIYKAWGLQSVSQLRKRLFERFPDLFLPVEEGKETSDLLFCFFEKFSHWWQIQLSLKLPLKNGTLWETIPILNSLKQIVEQYDYDHFGGDRNCFLPIKTVQQKYKFTDKSFAKYESCKTHLDTNLNVITTDETPEIINTWIRGGKLNDDRSNALCVEDDEDK